MASFDTIGSKGSWQMVETPLVHTVIPYFPAKSHHPSPFSAKSHLPFPAASSTSSSSLLSLAPVSLSFSVFPSEILAA
ncbi:hypothetical protein L2E82_51204 [Cichorium intybus]|nr:hypothetical protein L2E82_51204 [Cichorium intybus]